MSQNNILPDEELTDLCIKNRKVLQKKQGFRFSIDAVLLAHFIAPKKGNRVLDLGTGSAVIPLLLTAHNPGLHVTGVEVQTEIADMARRSVSHNQLEDEIDIIPADLKTLSKDHYNTYDYVLSNPPFFPVGCGKQNPNPQIALSRHELACTLEDLIRCASRTLKPRGHFAMIHRSERLTEIICLCTKYHLTPLRLRMIQPNQSSDANLMLLEAVHNGKNTLSVLPPLCIYEEDGSYTPEVLSYY